MDSEVYHIPALRAQSVEALGIRPGGVYIDATMGGGGHSRAILEVMDATGRLYGFDRDIEALPNVPDDDRFTFVHSNFRYIANFLRYHGERKADGILADLGVSFHHFDDAARGFSFRSDAPLDMRMNRSQTLTAADIVAGYDEHALCRLLSTYGDVARPMPMARAIIRARAQSPVDTTGRLMAALDPVINPARRKKELAKVFQALRIEVNGEMDSLRRFLEAATEVLRPGGRLAVITYHSLEDRMVKNFMRTGNIDGELHKDFFGRVSTPWRIVPGTPVTPSPAEVEANPRSRSAKLRVAEYRPGTDGDPAAEDR